MTGAVRFDLGGRVALVTGASSGLGRAIAECYAGAGADVVLAARRAELLDEVAAGIRATRKRASTVAVDLADRGAIRRCADEAGRAFGRIDILVNAAGVNIRKPMLDLTPEDWDMTIAVNLAAPFFLAHALAPGMIARKWGRIVNIASQQALRAFNHSGAYGASKGGLAALTRSQAEAWSPHGVTANAIVPGFIATPMTEAVLANPDRAIALAGRTMVGRNGMPEDVVGAALFLASEASAYVTGQLLCVDGGFSAT